MFRSYMTVIALACLAATIGCSSSDGAGGAGGGGAGGSGGGGDGGQGGGGAGGSSTLVEDTVTLACTNSFSGDSTTISFLPWIMSIDPGEPVEPGAEFTAELTGTAFFDEGFLDAALDVLTTLNRIELTGLAGTVQVRSGGTGADVVLGVGDIPNTCARLDGNGDPIPCDPANDLTDPAGANSDCDDPLAPFNKCGQFVGLPLSDDCSAGGVCDMLGKNEGIDAGPGGAQCAKSGFCITGDLPLPLETKTGTYTADSDAAEMLFVWDEINTGAVTVAAGVCSVGGATCDTANGDADCAEGTCDSAGMLWELPLASSTMLASNGVNIVAAPIAVGLACTTAVRSQTVTDPTISGLSSPSPDSAVLHLQLGALCADDKCDDDNECTEDLCDPADGACTNTDVADGLLCDLDGAPGLCNAGVCVDANLCEEVDCTSTNECREDGTCNPGNGSCDPGAGLPVDTACDQDGGTRCDGNGSCVECTSADQCSEDTNECTAAACTAGACGQANVANDTPCADNVGVCTNGACVLPECIVDGDCEDNNECTINTCPSGSCVFTPDTGAACTVDAIDGTCDDAGMCITDLCLDAATRCDDSVECTQNLCNPGTGVCTNPDRMNGTPCGGGTGTCQAGTCETLTDPDPAMAILTMGCTNNITPDISILPFELTVDPSAIGGGQSVPVALDGVAVFSEVFLDAAQGAVPGGVTKADLVNLAATVQIRAGGTMPNTKLTNAPLATTCLIGGGACNPANDGASVPGSQPNTDCVPTGTFNPCQANVSLPTSSDCAVGGACDLLGKKVSQCDLNGFCVTGGLPLPLQEVTTNFTAAASGPVNFGYADQGTGATVNGNGTYALPAAVFTAPEKLNEIKVNASGLSVALVCTMAVDAGGPDGVGVPDQASPTPTSLLITFAIQ